MTNQQAASIAVEAAQSTQNGDARRQGADNVESLFPSAPQANRGKLAQALAQAAAARAAQDAKNATYATHLDEVVFSADLAERDTILNQADAIEAAALEISDDSDLKRVLVAAQMDHAEMTRKAMEVFGAEYVRTTDPKRLDVVVSKACTDNAMLAEAVRVVCAAAGTVRVDELVKVGQGPDGTIFAKRFVDIGDEEPGQDPEVTPKYLLTAALKAAVRFSNLLEEAKRQQARADALETENLTLRKKLDTTSAKQKAQDAHYQALCRAERERGEEAAYAAPRVIVTNGTHYLRLRPGMDPRLSWAYGITESMSDAVVFDTVEQAGAILNQINMFPRRSIHIDILSTLCVARVVTEDHGQPNGDATPTHYPPMVPALALPVSEKGSAASAKAPAGKNGVHSFDVSAGQDDDTDEDDTPAKPVKATKGVTKPVKAQAKPVKPVKAKQAAQAVASAKKPAKPVKKPTLFTKPVKVLKPTNRAQVLAAEAADRVAERKRLLDASRRRSAAK